MGERLQDNSAEEPAPPATKALSGWRRVASQISSRTTDLLAIGILLVAGLTLGRQTLQWWGQNPSLPSLATETGGGLTIGDFGGGPVALEFGASPYTMTREAVNGSRQTALDKLTAHCETLAAAGVPPQHAFTEPERKLLALVAELPPTIEQRGLWKLYVVPEGLATVICVRHFPSAAGPTATPRLERRIICWGFLFPAGEGRWSVYVFDSGKHGSAEVVDRVEVLLPPDCRRILSLRDTNGTTLMTYAGAGSAEAWKRHFSTHFSSRGWSAPAGWRRFGLTWSARFAPLEHRDKQSAEVHFSENEPGTWTGLLQFTPAKD